MVILLSKSQVMSLVTMAESIGAVENAFRELANGTARMPTRVSVPLPEKQGWLGVMPAFLSQAGSLATKIVTVYENNVTRHGVPNVLAVIILNDVETGRVEAVIEGSYITAMRTGAVAGVATRYLARQNATKLGIFGCGAQGRTQLEAVCQVREISSVLVYDRDKRRMQDFVSKSSSQAKILAAETPEEVVRGSEIIVTATTSTTPVFNGVDIRPGTHINAIGAFTPDARELDDQTITKAQIVVDSLAAAFEEAGDIVIPLRNGIISREDIWAELGEIAGGSKPGRTTDEEITVFKSVGLGIQDAAVARLVFEKARTKHIGTEVELTD
jgi:ornithine cyclodeaminase/alanine dehydrogenase